MKCIYGVDIGGTDTKLGIVKESGEILADGKIETKAADGPEALRGRILAWFNENRSKDMDAAAVGIGCAGLVDRDNGILCFSPNLTGWKDVQLARLFSDVMNVPVTVENDVNCAAYAEYRMGAGRETRHFICVTLGTGVGGGIVLDGELFRGAHGYAGEIGHTVILADGPACTSGCRGCIESLIGARAIVERAKALLTSSAERARILPGSSGESALKTITDFTVRDISLSAANGDELAAAVLRETGRYLGIGLCNLCHLFNPEAIAIGGGISRAGELILGPAREALRANAMNERIARVSVTLAELGNKASFLGAALLAGRET